MKTNFDPWQDVGIFETSIAENFIAPAPDAFAKEVAGFMEIGFEPEHAVVA